MTGDVICGLSAREFDRWLTPANLEDCALSGLVMGRQSGASNRARQDNGL